MPSWWDDNPYVLLTWKEGSAILQTDLAEPGWLKTYEEQLATATTWTLSLKAGLDAGPSLWMHIDPAQEKGFYVARHIHDGGTGREVIAYGLGKTRADHTDRLWILPGGIICGSEDVETIAIQLIRNSTI